MSDGFARVLGLSPAEINDRSLLELVHPDDTPLVVACLAELHDGAPEVLLECRLANRDGQYVHLRWVIRPVPGSDMWWASAHDTTEVHRLLAERTDLRAQLDLALGHATAAMWELDLSDGVFGFEHAAAEILGVPLEARPTNVSELAALVHHEDVAAVLGAFADLAESGSVEVDIRVGSEPTVRQLCIRGRVLDRDRRGRPVRAVGLVLDITTERAVEEQMLRMVMTDGLTGAPNRRAFDQTLRTEWRRCSRASEPLSILIIDIDDFKAFNDAFGHLAGDDALCAVARALGTAAQRPGDVVARFGGEEFAVLLPGTGRVGAMAVAHRMVDAVRGIALHQAASRPVSVSIGSATCLPDGTSIKPAALLAHADQALYSAKHDGKNRAVAYEHSIAARDAFLDAITSGLRAGEFEMYYQPVIALDDNHVVGLEALMRWNRPGHGVVAPDMFIAAAEASTLICDLGRWALHEATGQLAAWSRDNPDNAELRMAVNVSGRHVNTIDIVADIESALAASGIASRRLELELTETALVNEALAYAHLARVRALGVSVAIDDFGTGYTSIGQLPHLPADALKIDRSFIASTDPRQRELVTLMIAAAHAFELTVVAEGIEDIATLDYLRGLGCDTAQGYLIARPMPADRVPAWLAKWRAGSQLTSSLGTAVGL